MNPEMENLFSPTSNAIGTKLWAALVQSSGGELELWSVDVKDAYLMVPQEEKVYVEYNGNFYVLGRCLPGQRVGSKAWYEHLGQIVTEECSTDLEGHHWLCQRMWMICKLWEVKKM